jgi:hypothetical protein
MENAVQEKPTLDKSITLYNSIQDAKLVGLRNNFEVSPTLPFHKYPLFQQVDDFSSFQGSEAVKELLSSETISLEACGVVSKNS